MRKSVILPDNFDWLFYCHYYEDLHLAGIDSEKKATEHYLNHGCHEKRIYHSSALEPGDRFNELDFSYRSFYGIDQNFVNFVIQQTQLQSQSRVLEIGCGVGRLALSIADHVKEGHYDGLDVDYKSIDWCRTHLSTPTQNNCQFHQLLQESQQVESNGFRLSKVRFPYEDEQFDVVYSTTTFVHLPPDEVQQYLAEISRVLKKNGCCLLMFFLWNQLIEQMIKNKKTNLKSTTHHEHYKSMTNYANESANAFHENTVYQWHQQANLTINEVVYGRWSGSSEEMIYKDGIVSHKTIFKNKDYLKKINKEKKSI